jgi:hypothetical protein
VIRTSFARVLMSAGAAAAVIMLLLALGGGHQLPWQAALRLAGGHGDYVDTGVRIVPPSQTGLSPDGETGEEPDGMSRIDLEGDEVSPALATYGIDREGNLFEVHSPHTEVPRLAGPTI